MSSGPNVFKPFHNDMHICTLDASERRALRGSRNEAHPNWAANWADGFSFLVTTSRPPLPPGLPAIQRFVSVSCKGSRWKALKSEKRWDTVASLLRFLCNDSKRACRWPSQNQTQALLPHNLSTLPPPGFLLRAPWIVPTPALSNASNLFAVNPLPPAITSGEDIEGTRACEGSSRIVFHIWWPPVFSLSATLFSGGGSCRFYE